MAGSCDIGSFSFHYCWYILLNIGTNINTIYCISTYDFISFSMSICTYISIYMFVCNNVGMRMKEPV